MELRMTDNSILEGELTGCVVSDLWVVVKMGSGTDPGVWDTVLYPLTTASCRALI